MIWGGAPGYLHRDCLTDSLHRCLSLLIGAERKHYYNYLIILMTVVASMLSLAAMVGLIDGAFALMAIPRMTSTIILAPKVMLAERIYVAKI